MRARVVLGESEEHRQAVRQRREQRRSRRDTELLESQSLPILVPRGQPTQQQRKPPAAEQHDAADDVSPQKLKTATSPTSKLGEPRQTTWRQHDLFRFMTESSHAIKHENDALKLRLQELEASLRLLLTEKTRLDEEVKSYRWGKSVPSWVVSGIEEQLKNEEKARKTAAEDFEDRLALAGRESAERMVEIASLRASCSALQAFVEEDLRILGSDLRQHGPKADAPESMPPPAAAADANQMLAGSRTTAAQPVTTMTASLMPPQPTAPRAAAVLGRAPGDARGTREKAQVEVADEDAAAVGAIAGIERVHQALAQRQGEDVPLRPRRASAELSECAPTPPRSVSELGAALASRREELERLRLAESTTGLKLDDHAARQVSDAIESALGELLPSPQVAEAKDSAAEVTNDGADADGEGTSEALAAHVQAAARLAAREAAQRNASPDEIAARALQAAKAAAAVPFVERAKDTVLQGPEGGSGTDGDGAQVRKEEAVEVKHAAEAMAMLRKEDPERAVRLADEAISRGLNAAEAAAAGIGSTPEQAAAASAAAYNIGATYPQAEPLVAAAAAHAAALLAGEGADAGIAASAGVRAATALMQGSSLEQVHAQALATAAAVSGGDEAGSLPPLPGWSLESWLGSLRFDGMVSAALKKRLTEALGKSPKGDGGGGGKSRGEGGGKGISTGTSATLEEAFVRGLVTHGSVETVYGLLKETPLLHDIAAAIFQHASKLHQAKEQADAERKEQEAALQQATREQEQEQAVSRELPTSSTSSTSAALVGSNTRLLKGLRRAGQTALAATSVHAHLNAEFIASGARTLFFSKDASLYFEGLARLVGPPASTSDMAEALAAEHCSARDSDTPFEASNYGTRTTSRIEWAFVAEPASLTALTPHLKSLGLRPNKDKRFEWPNTSEQRQRRDGCPKRVPVAFEDGAKAGKRMEVDAMLGAQGEQPLSKVEWCVLRAYTGPMFVKYNGVLRAAISGDYAFLDGHPVFGNRYPTTLAVLAAAVFKLGKLTCHRVVYRAPGGALPPDFWKRSRNGTVGFLEVGCLSTSTDKHEALEYARRSKAGLIFEVKQGWVSRGAEISWLSQYPREAEILLPPVTALEVISHRIEDDIVIVTMQPSIKPTLVRAGEDDLYREKLQAESQAAAEAIARGSRARRQLRNVGRVVELRTAEARAQWQRSMLEAKLASALALHARTQSELAHARADAVHERWERCADASHRDELQQQLTAAQEELKKRMAEVRRAKANAQAAQEAESTAAKMMKYEMSQDGSPHLARTKAQEAVAEAAAKPHASVQPAVATAETHSLQRAGSSLGSGVDRRSRDGVSCDGGGKQVVNRAVERDISNNVNLKHIGHLEQIVQVLTNSVESGKTASAVAGLERVVELCMADEAKPRIKDADKVATIAPVAGCMKVWLDTTVVQAMGCCALACLTRCTKPYPRAQQSAADEANCITLVIKAIKTLGKTFDQPAREALANITKNDKQLTKKAIEEGAAWLAPEAAAQQLPAAPAPQQKQSSTPAAKPAEKPAAVTKQPTRQQLNKQKTGKLARPSK